MISLVGLAGSFMRKSLALAFTLWASLAQAQDIPNHSVPIGGGAGAVGFRSAGPCPTNQTLLWVSGTGADPTCGLSASNITVGTTSIGGGVSGRVLFDNAGILGEYPITGTAGNVVLSVGPTFTGTIIASAGTVSGTWTFNGLANFTSTFQIAGTTQSFPASGLLVGTTDSQTITNKSIAGSEVNSGTVAGSQLAAINLAAGNVNGGVVGTLPYANGGCNATTQGACTNNIFPGITRAGDIVYWNGSNWVTLPGNNSGTKVLQEDSSGNPSFVTVTGTGTVTNLATNAGTTGGPITSTGTITLDGNYTGWALSNCTLAASVGSNLLTVALKDNVGNDPSAASPCNLNYRNQTSTTGSLTLVPQTTAISISTNATGATLGTSANTAFRFWVVVFNNAATNVLALINCWDGSSILPLTENIAQSTTPISGSATSAGVFYTPNGITVNAKYFRILGYVEYTAGLATPGTYASGPNFVQAFGPGIRKPGEAVQILTNSTTTAGSTSSATFAALATGQSKAIIPTSAANPIRIFTQGTVVANVNANVGVQIARGSTLIGNPIAVNIGGSGQSQAMSILTYDFPNTTSSVTYQYQGKTGGGTMNYPAGATGSILEVQEIQG